jgi:hypothetical protein
LTALSRLARCTLALDRVTFETNVPNLFLAGAGISGGTLAAANLPPRLRRTRQAGRRDADDRPEPCVRVALQRQADTGSQPRVIFKPAGEVMLA